MLNHRGWTLGRLGLASLLTLLSCGTDPIGNSAPPPPDPPVVPQALAVDPGIVVTVRSSDDLQPMPSRVLITPLDPGAKVDFHSDGNAMSQLSPGVYGVPEGVMLPYGTGLIPLPSGSYRLRILQGMEYESVDLHVRVPKSQVIPVDTVLQHSVQFPEPGWVPSDQHIHSAVSFDSRVPTRHRVISEVCSGVTVLVPTEHVVHNDLSPEINDLGLSQYAVSIPGSEYGFAMGHIGIFPVQFDPRAPLSGAPSWEVWPWTTIDAETYFPLIHQMPGQPLVVINHPRLPPDLGYFYNLKWQPGQPLPAEGLFDGLEVLNGYETTPDRVVLMLRDWFYLLNRSQRVTAVGNSDTHRIDFNRPGYPRTYLHLPTDDPRRVLPSDVRQAMLDMQAVATNGPLVHLTVDGFAMGALDPVQGNSVTANLWADAPGWVDLTRLVLYYNGEQIAEVPINTRNHPALQSSIILHIPTDGWLVAVAVGDQALPTDIVGTAGGGKALPVAFTNPVWLDVDGDGKVKPSSEVPSLPEPFGKAVTAAALAAEAEPRLLETPLHAPLDCQPSEWPRWLR